MMLLTRRVCGDIEEHEESTTDENTTILIHTYIHTYNIHTYTLLLKINPYE